MEDVGGEFVLEAPEDSHGSVAGVADVGCWSGVEIWGCAEVAVGFFAFAEEEVNGPVFLGVVDVALAGGAVGCGGVL